MATQEKRLMPITFPSTKPKTIPYPKLENSPDSIPSLNVMLVLANANEQIPQAAHFGTVQNPINMMEMEHELVGKNLDDIRVLSKNYIVPEDGCASYSLLYKMLDEFENDLHLHVHLENNILFPKALDLEKNLN